MNIATKTLAETAVVFTEKRTTLPILETVKMNGRIEATDLETTYIAQHDTGFNGCFTAGEIKALAAGATAAKGLRVDEFPNTQQYIDDQNYGARSYVEPVTLVTQLKAVSSYCSDDVTRYNINGVCFERIEGSGQTYMVATNGHHLMAIDSCVALDSPGRPVSFRGIVRQAILPIEAIKKIVKVLSKRSETVAVSFSDSIARFEFGCETIYARLCDGVFPDWRQVVPSPGAHVNLRVDAKQLQSAIETITAIATPKQKKFGCCIRFNARCDSSDLRVTYKGDHGEASITLDLDSFDHGTNRKNIEFGLCAKYVLTYLKNACRGDEIYLAWRKDMVGVVMSNNKMLPGQTNVLMPMTLK